MTGARRRAESFELSAVRIIVRNLQETSRDKIADLIERCHGRAGGAAIPVEDLQDRRLFALAHRPAHDRRPNSRSTGIMAVLSHGRLSILLPVRFREQPSQVPAFTHNATRTAKLLPTRGTPVKTVLKVMLGIVLGFTVLIGGCVALFAGGVNQAQKDSDKSAITVRQYSHAKVGVATRAQLVADFGKPRSSDDVQAEGIKGIPKSDFRQSCIYYSRKGELVSLYQFCFDGNGKLRSKSSF